MAYKDDTIIYIPTYRRLKAQTTLARIPLSSGVKKGRVVLVCVKEEAKKLERKYEVPVLIQPDDVKNIAQKRAWIIEQCRYDRMVMLDDDLRFCYRPTFAEKKLITIPNDHEGGNRSWLNFERALEHYAHAGIAARMGAQEKNFRWQINTRMMYVLGYQTKIIQKKCRLGSMGTREDMDYTLQLLQLGYRNIVSYRLLVDQQFAKHGGMTEERTIEKSDRDAEKLAKRYPGIVEVQQKAYKDSIPRKEVRVAWRKAFNKEASRESENKMTAALLKKWGIDTTRNKNELL
jgi:hypothetical protein